MLFHERTDFFTSIRNGKIFQLKNEFTTIICKTKYKKNILEKTIL